jgi:hypothetical protein
MAGMLVFVLAAASPLRSFGRGPFLRWALPSERREALTVLMSAPAVAVGRPPTLRPDDG